MALENPTMSKLENPLSFDELIEIIIDDATEEPRRRAAEAMIQVQQVDILNKLLNALPKTWPSIQ